MAIGCVADVVHQRGDAHQPPLAAVGSRRQQAAALGRQGVVDPARQVHGAEGMAEATVLGPGKDQKGQSELADEPQPLQGSTLDQSCLELVGADEAVDWIAKRKHQVFLWPANGATFRWLPAGGDILLAPRRSDIPLAPFWGDVPLAPFWGDVPLAPLWGRVSLAPLWGDSPADFFRFLT